MKDKSGREVKVGDFIVYGQALGRCASLNYGRVTRVEAKTLRFIGTAKSWSDEPLQKESILRFSERLLVVEPLQVDSKSLKKLWSVLP